MTAQRKGCRCSLRMQGRKFHEYDLYKYVRFFERCGLTVYESPLSDLTYISLKNKNHIKCPHDVFLVFLATQSTEIADYGYKLKGATAEKI